MMKNILTFVMVVFMTILSSCSGGDVLLKTSEENSKFSGDLRQYLTLNQGETSVALKKIKMQGVGEAYLMELPVTIQISEDAQKSKVDLDGLSLKITDAEGENLLIIPIGTEKQNRSIIALKEKIQDAINEGKTEVTIDVTADIFEQPYLSVETGELLKSKACNLVAYRTNGIVLNKTTEDSDIMEDSESAEGDDTIQTDMVLEGKIGGKYPIHMTLNGDRTGGSYYYDKSGPDNCLTLYVTDYDAATGLLKMEERNDKGEVTGRFEGRLTAKSYVGTLTLTNGKEFTFDLTSNVNNDHSGSQDISSNTSGSNHSGTIVLTTEEIRIDASLGYNYVYELHPDGSAMVHEYTYGYEYGDEKHEHPKKSASNPDRHYEGEWSTFNRQKGNSYQKVYRVDYDGKHRFIPEDFKYSYSDIHEMNSHNTKSAIKIKSVNK